jgi:site-specific DNA-methyltransferase (cytosine-N4-specific)
MTARLLVGDVNERIGEIPDGTVDAVICSPPFLALRKYGGDDAEMGSEANPAAFIDALLDLTAQFRRVLAPHGSIAIELGDTYSGPQPPYRYTAEHQPDSRMGGSHRVALDGFSGNEVMGEANITGRTGNGWPLAKSLAGIPEAYMLSLAYGHNVLNRHAPDSPAGRWRVRNVVVWARPNPPVGALGDKVRPATSYITVACTSAKRWFDLDAVRTPPGPMGGSATPGPRKVTGSRQDDGLPHITNNHEAGAPPLDWWEDDDPTGHAALVLPTQPYPGAHYATWPPTLAKRLIEMLCPLRVCTVCGEPSRRIVGEAEYVQSRNGGAPAVLDMREGVIAAPGVRNWSANGAAKGDNGVTRNAPTVGWTDCGHNARRNGHVLDPFAGSGTTLAVAHGCGRDATGIELYENNGLLIRDRLGMFLEVS